ncbi:hypothetical protein DPMN_149884 [Dreissena polymorpha]|uniref:Uncharacterized protein n=1 Tax=Dreissena polymorpha TaxID=45954 RepID=A0A9D4FCL8_DREPO|nr:hypothetical protein DPMN_149884 [Dreissena polymorpha]
MDGRLSVRLLLQRLVSSRRVSLAAPILAHLLRICIQVTAPGVTVFEIKAYYDVVKQVILLLTEETVNLYLCFLFELEPTLVQFVILLLTQDTITLGIKAYCDVVQQVIPLRTKDDVHIYMCFLFELEPSLVQLVILLLTQDTVHYYECVLFELEPTVMWSSKSYFFLTMTLSTNICINYSLPLSSRSFFF